MSSIAIIGAGPRGVGLLERLVRNLLAEPQGQVDVHLIDPHPPGAGRIWRAAQSPLLKLNSLAADVTMFTDESSTIEGPVHPGPSLVEWAKLAATGVLDGVDLTALDPDLRAEIAKLGPATFPSRRLQSLYLDWFHRRQLAAAPDDLHVHTHAATALGVEELPGRGRGPSQRVLLDTGEPLEVDVVVYALGHSGTVMHEGSESARLAAFSERHGLAYVPPSFTADADLSGIAAGEPVIVRGLGLAGIDLLVLLGEGRGGRFELTSDEAGLTYVPSGREPRILIGSRRGVPYHSKVTSVLQGEAFETRYFTLDIAKAIIAEHDVLDFRAQFWPLVAKEMLHGYYRELFTGHPHRVRTSWVEFRNELDTLDASSPELSRIVAAALVHPADALDLDTFERPLRGAAPADLAGITASLEQHIRDDLFRRNSQQHSENQGLFLAVLHAYMSFVEIQDAPGWTPESQGLIRGWWKGFFSFIASGPPGHRLDELLALIEAGVVQFLGGGVKVWADDAAGEFRAAGPGLTQEVSARALVDAWLPDADVAHTDSAALRQLLDRGEGREKTTISADGPAGMGVIEVRREDSRVVRADGSAHPRRFAIGPYTSNPFVGAFSRPGTDAVSFRENDSVARSVLQLARELSATPRADGAPEPHPDSVRTGQHEHTPRQHSREGDLDELHREVGSLA